MTRVAGYCRVSTDKEDQVNSYEAQQRYFREYINRSEDWELYDIYADASDIIGLKQNPTNEYFIRMNYTKHVYNIHFPNIITQP